MSFGRFRRASSPRPEATGLPHSPPSSTHLCVVPLLGVKRARLPSDSGDRAQARKANLRQRGGAKPGAPWGQPSYRTGRNRATQASSCIQLRRRARGRFLLGSRGLCGWAMLDGQADGGRVPAQDQQGARVPRPTASRSAALQSRTHSHARHDAPELAVPLELLSALPPGHQLDPARRECGLRFHRRHSSPGLHGIAFPPRQHSPRRVSQCGPRRETRTRAHVGHGNLPVPFQSRDDTEDAILLRAISIGARRA